MEVIYVCYEVVDDDTLHCVGTAETKEDIYDFAYAMSRRTDCEYQVYRKVFYPEDGTYERDYLCCIWNGVFAC